jgi:predicted transposase/invertase (TIGR01784 family)
MMLPEKNPQLKHAVGKLMELSADERERMIAESRSILQGDIKSLKMEAAAAEAKGRSEGQTEALHAVARNLLRLGIPVEKIIEATGLPIEEIRALMH